MYTHVALEVLDTNEPYTQLAELAFYDENGALASQGGQPYATDTFWQWLADLAFDGVESTQFSSNQPLPDSRIIIGTALAKPIVGISSYTMTARAEYPEGIPKAWRVGLSTGTRLAKDNYDYDWLDIRKDVGLFAPGETRVFVRLHTAMRLHFTPQLRLEATAHSRAPQYTANININRLGKLAIAATARAFAPIPPQVTGVTGTLVVPMKLAITARHQLRREHICELTIIKRPEGGAVEMTFTMPQGYQHLIILRYKAGTKTNPVTVYDDTPLQAGRYRFGFFRYRDKDYPQRRGRVYDLEAFADKFTEDDNNIDEQAFDYWFIPKTENGRNGDVVVARAVIPRRIVASEMEFNLKDAIYHRLRYHANTFAQKSFNPTVFVARQDHINGAKDMPQILLKARHVMIERPIGRVEHKDTYTEHDALFRGIVDIMVVSSDVAERDRLGDFVRLSLFSDFHLLESLNYNNINLNDMDGHISMPEDDYYTRELTLEGELNGYVIKEKTVKIPLIVIFPFVPYQICTNAKND